ncbi:Zn-ribbon domain-containing OB-fold protein [Actinoallomurus acaciae]|uniref:Zn-ribbon domain-containing OB-fold protein n=1 Tax=Actinoallomurus acaciae TaxID=502577 RepID=A0ABV5YPN6_9ACTN
MSADQSKAIPRPTPETRPFWDGAAAGELRIQRCVACARHYFYPRPICPHCGSSDVEWVTASGRARLYSYVISHRPAPGFADDGPYAIAVVELEEGVRMMTNIVHTEITPANLELNMPLRVVFEPRGDVHVPLFEPTEEGP